MSSRQRARPRQAPSIVVVGAASRDLDPADPRGWRLGGGVTYSTRLLARLGLRVGAVMGLDAVAASAAELHELEALGVDIRRVTLGQGPVFENRQTKGGREQVAHGASDPMQPDALPRAWRSGPAYLLNPVAGEIDHPWVDVLPGTALVALGYQGLLRALRPGHRVVARPLVSGPLGRRADLASLSHEDVTAGAPPLDQLLTRDGQRLVITEGPRGAMAVRRSGGAIRLRYVPAVPARRDGDATGAGDTFLAAWLAATLSQPGDRGPESPHRGKDGEGSEVRSLAFAALCASLLVEGVDPSRRNLRERHAELRPPDVSCPDGG